MKQIVLLIMVYVLGGCFGAESQKSGKEGKPMPEFTLLLTDSITRLHSQEIPTGKPTVLFYFSPYCPHCKSQTKKIVENNEELKHIQFYFVSKHSLREIKDFNKEYQLSKYPNITLAIDSASLIQDYFEIPGIPYLAIYGKKKKLVKSFLGTMYISQIKKAAEG